MPSTRTAPATPYFSPRDARVLSPCALATSAAVARYAVWSLAARKRAGYHLNAGRAVVRVTAVAASVTPVAPLRMV